MNPEETIEFLEPHVGKTVEVVIAMPVPSRDEPVRLAGFWGQLGRLTKSGASDEPEARYVWMREGARHAMHRSRHIGAEAAADAQQLV